MIFDRHTRTAFFVLCAVLLFSAVGFRVAVAALNITLQKQPVPLRDHFASIPSQLGEWRAGGEDRVLGEAVIESLGTSDYLNRRFVRETDNGMQVMELHLAYYTGEIDAVPHVPDRCFVAGGGLVLESLPQNIPMSVDTSRWRPNPQVVNDAGEPYPEMTFAHHLTGRPVTVHLPLGEYELRSSQYSDKAQPQLNIYAGYFFIANGSLTPTPGGVRSLAFDPTTQYAYYCKVQFTMIGRSETEQSEFIDAASDLTEHLMPHLMRCLPDWPEVEAAQRTERSSQRKNAAADAQASTIGRSPAESYMHIGTRHHTTRTRGPFQRDSF